MVISLRDEARAVLVVADQDGISIPTLEHYRRDGLAAIGVRTGSGQYGGVTVNAAFPFWNWITDLKSIVKRAPAGRYGDFVRQIASELDPGDD